MINKNFKTINAFTLAEVLITLGVIGVVAAMTLPGLIQKQMEKTVAIKLKKEYSVINQAYRLAVLEYGNPDKWVSGDENKSSQALDKISKYLNITRQCKENEDCGMNNMYLFINGNQLDLIGYAKVILANGTIIYLNYDNQNCNSTKTWLNNRDLKTICGGIYIDVNGTKKPNKMAMDLFGLYLTMYNIYPSGTDDNFVRFDTACKKDSEWGTSWGCTHWVLQYENLDYLHCTNLSTKGQHKCQ